MIAEKYAEEQGIMIATQLDMWASIDPHRGPDTYPSWRRRNAPLRKHRREEIFWNKDHMKGWLKHCAQKWLERMGVWCAKFKDGDELGLFDERSWWESWRYQTESSIQSFAHNKNLRKQWMDMLEQVFFEDDPVLSRRPGHIKDLSQVPGRSTAEKMWNAACECGP